MKDEKRTNLYPPVLASWGSMMPPSPPSGYGNISFDPDQPEPQLTFDDDARVDAREIASLRRIFARRLRTI